MKQKNEKAVSKNEKAGLDILFCIFITSILVYWVQDIMQKENSYFVNNEIIVCLGHIGICALSFILFIDLFDKKYVKLLFFILILVTLFILFMSFLIVGHPFKEYTFLKFVDNLTATMTILSIVSDFAKKERLETLYNLYGKIKNIILSLKKK